MITNRFAKLSTLTYLFLLSFFPVFLLSQEPFKRSIDLKQLVAENEMEGKLTLIFVDAETGAPIKGGQVLIEESGEYTTGINGDCAFDAPFDGIYKVSFKAEKHIRLDFAIEVMANSLWSYVYPVSRELDIRHMRIVVTWGNSPRDLDAHLLKEGGYHISFRNMRAADDGSARLDRDDVSGYGPETITITQLDKSARYTFRVHDYTNSSYPSSEELSKSGAIVTLFAEGKQFRQFSVPRVRPGTVWKVFTIERGEIIPQNEIFAR